MYYFYLGSKENAGMKEEVWGGGIRKVFLLLFLKLVNMFVLLGGGFFLV